MQYRDVGTALTILPTIDPEGYVNLLVTQEVSGATGETQFGAHVISSREAQTHLLARSTRVSSGSSELFLFLMPQIVATDDDADRLREALEGTLDLLRRFVPIVPLIPPVVLPDTSGIGG